MQSHVERSKNLQKATGENLGESLRRLFSPTEIVSCGWCGSLSCDPLHNPFRFHPRPVALCIGFVRPVLIETPAHSLYGLRHSFEDRMIAARVDERVRRDLFGHAYNRERYGKEADLKHLHEVVTSVAL